MLLYFVMIRFGLLRIGHTEDCSLGPISPCIWKQDPQTSRSYMTRLGVPIREHSLESPIRPNLASFVIRILRVWTFVTARTTWRIHCCSSRWAKPSPALVHRPPDRREVPAADDVLPLCRKTRPKPPDAGYQEPGAVPDLPHLQNRVRQLPVPQRAHREVALQGRNGHPLRHRKSLEL